MLYILLLFAAPSNVDAVIHATLDGHPSLMAIEARIEALEAGVVQAGVQADPMLGLQYSNMPLTRPWPGGHPMSGIQLSVRQQLTGATKIDARVALAKSQVAADRHTLADARNRLGAIAASGWHRLALLRALGGLTVAHQATVQQLRSVLQVRYATNSAGQHDLLQLDLLTAQLGEAKADFDAEARVLQARLNAAMAREPLAQIITPDVTTAPAAPTLAQVLEAIEKHPKLMVLTARIAAEQAGVARADAERKPDVTVSGNYRFRVGLDGGDPGDDFVGVGVSMPLPWLWNDERWGAQAARHQASQQALRSQAEALRRMLRADVAAAHTELSRARRRAAEIDKTLLPTARAGLDSSLAGFRVGRASFEALYRAQRVLLDLEQARRMALTAAALASVRIQAATGQFAEVSR
jgi:outer membrane protein TolC